MWVSVDKGSGGRGGGALSKDPARLSPNYLTVSADVWRDMGAPKYVTVEVNAQQRAIRITPTTDENAFLVGDNHRNRENGRRRISVGAALTKGNFTDVRKGGERVDCIVNPDNSAVFKLR